MTSRDRVLESETAHYADHEDPEEHVIAAGFIPRPRLKHASSDGPETGACDEYKERAEARATAQDLGDAPREYRRNYDQQKQVDSAAETLHTSLTLVKVHRSILNSVDAVP